MKRGYFAPVFIGIVIALYYLTIGIFIVTAEIPILWKVLGIVVPLGLAVTMIYVSLERIKEIKGGEEDDLGKY